MYYHLQRDRDRDVRHFANSPLSPEDVEALHGERYSAKNEHLTQDSSPYDEHLLLGNQPFLSSAQADVLSRAFEQVSDGVSNLQDEPVDNITYSSSCLGEERLIGKSLFSTALCIQDTESTYSNSSHMQDSTPNTVYTVSVPLLSPDQPTRERNSGPSLYDLFPLPSSEASPSDQSRPDLSETSSENETSSSFQN